MTDKAKTNEKSKSSAIPGVTKAPDARKRNQPLLRGTRDLSDKKITFKKEGVKPKKLGATNASDDTAEFSDLSQRRNRRAKGQRNNRREQRVVSEFEERILDIARVTNVVKGGRRFSFSAYVVIGNRKGKVGFGHGKANEVPDAIKKAVRSAQNNLITVPIIDKHTVPHDAQGKYLASKVLLKPSPKGKGLIASGTVRAVTELAGYTDIYSKTYGSRTKMNTAKATLEALKKMRTVEQIAELRDVPVDALKLKVSA